MPVLTHGQKLGSYEVQGILGRGGMAEVYRATHRTLERNAAIKVLNPALNADPTFPLRFLREAKAVARLNHPNIITIYDFGEEGDLAYLVMELATDGTFRERARQFKTLGEAIDGLAPICEALQYAHERGIVHRDIKPINVLVSEHARPLLADFGLARVVSESIDLTEAGMGMGSPHYMAPEQALGQDVDQRADIYALGIVVYEVLAGSLPYVGTSPYAIIRQQISEPLPSIRAAVPSAPVRLDNALHRAAAKKREERFASTADFLAELRQCALEAPDLPIGVAAGERPADSRSTRSGSIPGGSRNPLPAPEGDSNEMTSVVPPTGLANLPALDQPNSPSSEVGTTPATEWSSDETIVLPARPRPAKPEGIPPSGPNRALPPSDAREPAFDTPTPVRKRRRPTSFNRYQWLTLATVLLIIMFINAIGLWLTLAGRSANEGTTGTAVTGYIYDHLGAFKSSLAGLALVLAALATAAMQTALSGRQISPQLYRRLRQYHRLVGYAAVLIAFAVGLLTCIGIFGFGTKTPRAALHSVLGTSLLVLIVVKIAIVRYFPSQRRHLRLLGEALLVLFFLVFATSTIPFLWSHLTGTSKQNPYNPYVGRSIDRPAP
ncbi:MAG: DUF6529 family protein [Dehalococcoidia bacterium]